MTHYQIRYDTWDTNWIVLLDDAAVEGLTFADENQAKAVMDALNAAVALGESKCKDAIRETAELFFSR